MGIFEQVFSRVHAAAQVKNENLTTESREDKLIKGTLMDNPRLNVDFVSVNFYVIVVFFWLLIGFLLSNSYVCSHQPHV